MTEAPPDHPMGESGGASRRFPATRVDGAEGLYVLAVSVLSLRAGQPCFFRMMNTTDHRVNPTFATLYQHAK